MTDSTITLYYDCLSPFSFFAFSVIDRYVKAGLWPASFVLKPILLGGVMAATGNAPPGACVFNEHPHHTNASAPASVPFASHSRLLVSAAPAAVLLTVPLSPPPH